MSSLTEIFKTEPEETQGNDKLVDLFRNRAELKKEFAALRDEKYQLQDRVKQQQGATARVQQKMDHLENLLSDREWVYSVAAFYQLRRLGGHCAAKLSRFSEELKQQREQRVHGKALDEWNAQRDERSYRIDAEIGEARLKTQLLEDQLLSERHRLMTMNAVSKLLNGKKLAAGIEVIESRIRQGHTRESELLYSRENLQNLSPPDQEGLDVATKRSINLMILAFAQQLYLHFYEDKLASLAKEAMEKSVGAINYGSKHDCDEIIKRIEQRCDAMESISDYADILQNRVRLISKHVTYRTNDEVIPSPGTAAIVYEIDANGVVKQTDANIIGDNYFGITKVLSR